MHRLKLDYRLTKLVRGVASETNPSSVKDVFGTLSERGSRSLAVRSAEQSIPDDADGYDKEEFDLTPRKNLYYYKYEISKHARQGSVGIRKALELFHNMKSNDRLTPTLDQFSPLIYGCAKAGYTKKAFELYEESIKYYDKPTKSTVTCLLNACAESPFQEYGLKRLDWFVTNLKVNYNYNFNKIQYHSAIKAYGKLGQLNKASDLVQEMIDNGINPDVDTFNMLLIGCASEKDRGSILALRVYKRLKYFEISPNIFTFTLLLRCIRDCGMGSSEMIQEAIGELPAMTTFNQRLKHKQSNRMKSKNDRFEWVPLITDAASSIKAAIESPASRNVDVQKLVMIEDSKDNLEKFPIDKALVNMPPNSSYNITEPVNLLSENHLELIHRIEGIDFDKLHNGENRLMLFGGVHEYLETMVREGCKPDNKTFSLILSCVKHTIASQIEYFRLAQDYQIKRDLLFYDLLIRHVCETFKDRSRLDRALHFIEQMQKDNIRPNISTFESLALGCDDSKQALKLISDIKSIGFTVSGVLIKRLFECAIYRLDFEYLSTMITISKEHNYRPAKNLVEELEEKRLYAHDKILLYENGQIDPCDHPGWLTPQQIRNFDVFNKELGCWLRGVELATEEHPWTQYHVDSTSRRVGFNNFTKTLKTLYKVKEEALKTGQGFGNLMAKAEELRKQAR